MAASSSFQLFFTNSDSKFYSSLILLWLRQDLCILKHGSLDLPTISQDSCLSCSFPIFPNGNIPDSCRYSPPKEFWGLCKITYMCSAHCLTCLTTVFIGCALLLCYFNYLLKQKGRIQSTFCLAMPFSSGSSPAPYWSSHFMLSQSPDVFKECSLLQLQNW